MSASLGTQRHLHSGRETLPSVPDTTRPSWTVSRRAADTRCSPKPTRRRPDPQSGAVGARPNLKTSSPPTASQGGGGEGRTTDRPAREPATMATSSPSPTRPTGPDSDRFDVGASLSPGVASRTDTHDVGLVVPGPLGKSRLRRSSNKGQVKEDRSNLWGLRLGSGAPETAEKGDVRENWDGSGGVRPGVEGWTRTDRRT